MIIKELFQKPMVRPTEAKVCGAKLDGDHGVPQASRVEKNEIVDQCG